MENTKIKTQMRENWLDYIRIFACFSVLLFHVINGYLKDAVNYESASYPYILKSIVDLLNLYPVPTFMCLSGFLYQKFSSQKFTKKKIGKEYLSFLKKKIINLGIPYFVFSILYVVLSSGLSKDMHTSYGFSSILELHKTPVAQYWYLHTLIIVMFFAPLATRICANNIYIIMLIAVVIRMVDIEGALGNVQALVAFFVLGMFLEWKKIIHRINLNFYIVFTLLGSMFFFSIKFFPVNNMGEVFGNWLTFLFQLFLIVEIFFCAKIILDRAKWSSRILWLSKYTFHIYLIHTWITGVIRVVLWKMGVENFVFHILIGTGLGGMLSVMFSMIAKRVFLLNVFFEPINTLKTYKKKQIEEM